MYLQSDCVLCKVAIWGKTIPATRGARGQYAYPQEMWVPDNLADVAPLIADLYKIPTRPLNKDDIKPRPLRPLSPIPLAQHKELLRSDARDAAKGFAAIAAILYAATTIGWLTPIPDVIGNITAGLGAISTVLSIAAWLDSRR